MSVRVGRPAGLWRYRVPVFGLLAIALAVVGEQLMRTVPGASALDPQLGTLLVQIALLLVGPVSLVYERLPWSRPRAASPESAADVRPLTGIPVRRAGATANDSGGRIDTALARPGVVAHVRRRVRNYLVFRARYGRQVTALGLLPVLGLTFWCCLLVWTDFANPLAPWIWLAMLACLILVFGGARPRGETLLPNDPAERWREQPVSRIEWVVLLGIIVAALVLRVWNLEQIPTGPYMDEGDRANVARAINMGGPLEFNPFGFFATDWFGVPNLYFWLVSQSLRLFGDNLGGARMVHALAGVATVWYTYRIGRLAWSPRVGLMAAALLAISDFAIHFSRTAGESTISLFTWTACVYFLYKALKTLRPLDFAWSGVAAGLCMYGYASAKLLPVLMAIIAIYLLLRWGLNGAKRYLPGLTLLGLAALLTWAPNATFVLRHPDVFTWRYNSVSIFNNVDAMRTAYNTDNWGIIAARQFELTYAAFDVGSEHGPFYPTRQPVLPVPWAATWVLGVAYILWRFGDARFAVLGLWLLGGLAGAALTTDTPTLQRVAGMVPTLALVPAIFLDRVVTGMASLLRADAHAIGNTPPYAIRNSRNRKALSLSLNAGLAAFVLVSACWTVPYYFITYQAEGHFYNFTLAGRYAERLDPSKDMVYESGPNLAVMGQTVFLAHGVPLPIITNPSDMLPITENNGRNVHFLFSPPDNPQIELIRDYYPDSTITPILGADGKPLFTALRVAAASIDARRQVTARYTPAGGTAVQRLEPRLGTLGPQSSVLNPQSSPDMAPPVRLTYPVQAEWTGQLVAPSFGTYHFSLVAPGGAELELDGSLLLATPTGSRPAVEAQTLLARGVHRVRLAGKLGDPSGQVEVRWSKDDSRPAPISREFLWNGQGGTLVGQVYGGPAGSIPSSVLTAQTPITDAMRLIQVRRDGSIAWADINQGLRDSGIASGDGDLLAIWEGTVGARTEGDYTFDMDGNGALGVLVDGKPVGASGGSEAATVQRAPPLPARVHLAAGEHEIEVRFLTSSYDTKLFVYWQQPNGKRELLVPSALAPG